MKLSLSKNDKIIYSFLLIIIVAMITLMLLFNILMKTYIEKKAIESLQYYKQYDIYFYSNDLSEDKYEEMYDNIFNQDEDLLFIPLNIYIDIGNNLNYSNMAPFEAELCAYIDNNLNNIRRNEIYKFSNGKQNVYYVLMKKYNIRDYDTIMYVDISAVLSIVDTVNKILVITIIMAIFTILVIAIKSKTILDKSDRNEKQFFSNASHELKTPLMSIQGYAEGLQREMVDAKQAGEIILKESERMNSLISSILELSKLDSNMIKMTYEKHDLREIIYDAIEVNSVTANNRELNFVLDIDEAVIVECDDKAMFAVFSNIISNAVRYANSKIYISLVENKSEIVVKISNDGLVDQSLDISRIFNRFYKGNNGNTGLGLTIAKEYVNKHRGKLEVSIDKKMIEFKISLSKIYKM